MAHYIPRPRYIRLVGLALVLLSAMLTGCPEELPEEKPQAPDMTALAASYATPTAALTAETIPAILEAMADEIGASGLFCGWASVEDLGCTIDGQCASCEGMGILIDLLGVVGDTTEAPDETTAETRGEDPFVTAQYPLQVGDTTVEGEGFIELTKICQGWETPSVADAEANGTIYLVVGFGDDAVDPVIFGSFDGCKYLSGDTPMEIDLSVSIFAPDGMSLEHLDSLTLLVQLSGEMVTGEEHQSLDMDFEVSMDGSLGLKLPVDGEHLVFFVTPTTMGFRAANGDWTCDFGSSTCTASNGASVSW